MVAPARLDVLTSPNRAFLRGFDYLSSAASVLQIENRYWARKIGLLQLLADVDNSGLCHHTVYLTRESVSDPGALEFMAAQSGAANSGLSADLADIDLELGASETGRVLFLYDDQVIAVAPPFPIKENSLLEGADTTPLRDLLGSNFLIGVILLRLGRYVVGAVRGDNIVASKSGSRYVKRRHRAGGSSQRRFERSRERLVRELFDKTCQTAREIFDPFQGQIDFLLMGGARHTLAAFVRTCTFLRRSSLVMLNRSLEVNRPGRQAMERIPDEVWKSRVVVLTRSAGG